MTDHAGVMNADYAAGRVNQPQLGFRYKVRARYAVDAYLGRTAFAEHAVLELGAAEGRTLLEVRRLLGGGGVYDGVELSQALLDAAPSMPENVRLLRGDVQALPPEIEDGRYTLVTALAVLEHLPDPAACLREAFRALRPGGVLVASAPHPRWDHLAGALKLVADEHHAQELTAENMAALARDAGFEAVLSRPFMFSPVGILPYLRVAVDPAASLRIDAWVREKLPRAEFLFVNQGISARKPAR